MYIREVCKIKDGKRYSCLVLVESVRTAKGPRQKTILTLGNIKVPKEKWKELAWMIKRRLSGQSTLIKEDEGLIEVAEKVMERIRMKGKLKAEVEEEGGAIKANVKDIRVEQAREVGSCLVAEEYWERLKMEEILKGCGFKEKEVMRAKVEIFGRLISPQSENGTVEWVNRVGIKDMWGNRWDKISRDGLYRVSDKLIKWKDEIERRLAEREAEVFELGEMIYLYDLTSSYFEGECKRNKKAKYGYSRDKRGDCKQVVVGLVIDKEGFIKGHEVYEGRRADIKTIKEVVKKLKEKARDKGKDITIIIDRGMVSEESIAQIKEAGMDFIVTLKQGMRDKLFDEFNGRDKKEIKKASGEKIEVEMKEIGGEKYILCKSEERGKKERGIRERFKERMEEGLKRLGRMIERGKIKDREKIRERIGKIRQKNRRVSRYYKIEIKEEKGLMQLLWEQIEEEPQKDGTYLLRTSRVDLGEEEIWKLYMMLTRIERAFRELKSDLGLRPIYHQKEERVEGHIFISILAYHLLHAIEHTLRVKGDNRSWRKIKEILKTHQTMTIVIADKENKIAYHIRTATVPEAQQREIYKKLSIDTSRLKTKMRRYKVSEL